MTGGVASTTLPARWVLPMRVLWLMLAIPSLLIAILGTLAQFEAPLPDCAQPGAACRYWDLSQADMQVALELGYRQSSIYLLTEAAVWLVKLAYALLAALIFWRKPSDWMAWLLSVMLIGFTLEGIGTIGFDLSAGTGLYYLSAIIFMYLPFLFPNGRFVPRWTRWMTGLVALLILLALVNFDAAVAVLIIWFVVAAYAVVHRYTRAASLVERQQLKWVMAGIFGWGVIFTLLEIGGAIYPPQTPSVGRLNYLLYVNQPLYSLSLSFIPLTIAIAILRYRLFDIDVLIRRTLQYALLTGLLALVYFGGVVSLQTFLSPLAETRTSPIVTVATTLGIAALFTPLRQRTQELIDRRFYRRKYDAEQALVRFAEAARSETDLAALTSSMVDTVQLTLQPESITVWIIDQDKKKS